MENENTIIKNYLTYKEAAAYIGIHINTLYRHQEIPHIHFGRKVLYKKSTLDKYFEDLEQKEEHIGSQVIRRRN